ncbi:DNA mismatch endonuclease Vsr [Sinorhizobium sp. BG8]|nr:very short patch repair endonuclease [Sinorhizobium sp. BG8]QRM56400.1 DNA mismatch endonuclease Vsr [Sinorhizobium sp. BG8]
MPALKRTDVHSPSVRSFNMSRIRSVDTAPEMLIRRGLHARGRRFRLHTPNVPGRPDLLFPKHQAAFFVHGCFWHGHTCPLFRVPASRTEFWIRKIGANRLRDQRNSQELVAQGWRVLVIWECSTRGRAKRPVGEVLDLCESFLDGDTKRMEITGEWE